MAEIQQTAMDIIQSILKTGYIVGGMILGAVILFLFVWFVIRPTTYKLKVRVFQKRAGEIIKTWDRGKIIPRPAGLMGLFQTDGVRRLILLKRKATLPAPEPDYITRENGVDTINVYRYGQNDYTYITIKDDISEQYDVALKKKFAKIDLELIPSGQDMKLWYVQTVHDVMRRNTPLSKLEKLATPIMLGFFMITIILGIYMLAGTMKHYSENVTAQSTNMIALSDSQKEVAQSIRDAAAILKGLPTIYNMPVQPANNNPPG